MLFFEDIYLPFGYRATRKVRPEITSQHASEVLLAYINHASLIMNHEP